MMFESIHSHPGRFVSERATRGRARALVRMVAGIVTAWSIAAVSPRPQDVVASIDESDSVDSIVGSVALLSATAVLWAVVIWSTLVVGAAVVTRAPGALGRVGHVALRGIAPAAVRRVVLVAVGLSLASGAAACAAPSHPAVIEASPAAAPVVIHSDAPIQQPSGDASTESDAIDLDLSWPLSEHSDLLSNSEAPTPAPAPAPTPAHSEDAAPESAPEVVTVMSGDSLWSLAAGHLGPAASDSDIDAAWREWYALNRDVIGDDPNLILPGQHFIIPTTDRSSS